MWLHTAHAQRSLSWTVLGVDVVDFEKLPNVLILLVDNGQQLETSLHPSLPLLPLPMSSWLYKPFHTIHEQVVVEWK